MRDICALEPVFHITAFAQNSTPSLKVHLINLLTYKVKNTYYRFQLRGDVFYGDIF